MTFKSAMQGTAKLQLSNILISYGIILLCALHLFHFKHVFNIGTSKCLYIIGGLEITRWLTNKYGFKVSATSKEGNYIASGSSTIRSNAKKPTIVSTFKYVLKIIIIFITFTIFFAFSCILMGASVIGNYEETFELSVMLTLLTIMPIALYLGPTAFIQYISFDFCELSSRNEMALLEYLEYSAMASLIGAWCGSAVAPLDWDRDWQKYPTPNIIGGLCGFTLANTHTLLLVAFDLTKKNVNKGKKNL